MPQTTVASRWALLAVSALVLSACGVVTDGFETGDFSAWTGSHGLTTETSVVRSGTFAAEADATDGNAWARRQLPNVSATVSTSASVRLDSVGTTGTVGLLGVRSSLNAPVGSVVVDPQAHIGFANGATATTTLSSTSLPLGSWHKLELHVTVNGSAGSFDVLLDGTIVTGLSGREVNLGTTPAGYVQIGEQSAGRSYHAYFDDVSTTYSAEGPVMQPPFPIRAAFYYPWFPESWTQGGVFPFTNYHPSLGYYSSRDLATVRSHIRSMKYAGLDVGVASWWWQGHNTDQAVPTLLQAARDEGGDFRWTLYYEQEGNAVHNGPDPTVPQIVSDLTYIWTHYAQDPMYLRVGGRPVLFVYGDASDACPMATRWVQARNSAPGAFYIVLKVFGGYRSCPDQPDGWHQYAPAVATDSQGPFSYSISPGFWLYGSSPRLARDPAGWQQSIAAMKQSNARFELVTTFNEWGEGSAVESAAEWASASGQGTYLDALHAGL